MRWRRIAAANSLEISQLRWWHFVLAHCADCEAYATTKDRSDSDLAIIKGCIRAALKTKSVSGWLAWEKKRLDYGQLFKEFGTLLGSS